MTVEYAFAPEGALANALKGFRPRRQQSDMALAIAAAIDRSECLVAEAGTGTGKTLAYLVPLMISGKKALISTATKTLQDQLFRKDLPLVRRALEKPIRIALLKGRSNYLCLYRLQHMLAFRSGQSGRDALTLQAIRRWARTTQSGDIAEALDVPEQSPFWAAATSTVDNCLGQECPQWNDCFLVKARNRAREADIIVVNHHLLWADWSLRNEGYGELLPEVDAIVVDEAHQFLESAAQFLGTSISSRQLNELAEDTEIERLRDAMDARDVSEEAQRLNRLVDDARLALGVDARREAWHAATQEPEVSAAFLAILQQVLHLAELLKPLAVRGKGLESCHKRSLELAQRLDAFLNGPAEGDVRWFETRTRGFTLSRTPLDVAAEFSRFRQSTGASWIFTSATLTVAGKFDHFTRQLNLGNVRCQQWDSPFDYPRRCLLYAPANLPDPNARDYTRRVIDAVVPVLEASQGRAFVLFTSHQALTEAAGYLAKAVDFPLFVQGSQPKTHLLEAFKQAGHGILLGTATFWEGVDVVGPTLSCVIIDKLPFASPSDPVLSAKLESLRQAGLNPFVYQQLPSAIIALKQGVGRLIRDHADRGVLVLCDPRLTTKAYGKLFMNSLPAMPKTRQIESVRRFFAMEHAQEASDS